MAQENPYLAQIRARTTTPEPAKVEPEENPYTRAIREREEEQRRRMLAAQTEAAKTTPDARADALKLGAQTGLPTTVVERNYDKVKKGWGGYPFQQIQLRTPSLAEWSTNLDHAAVAADDMENLGAIEWLLASPSRAFLQKRNAANYAELKYKELLGQALSQEDRDLMGSYKVNSELGGDLGVDSWFGKAWTGAFRLAAQMVDPAKYALVGGLEIGVPSAAGGALLTGGPGVVPGFMGGFSVGARAGATYGVMKSTSMQEAVDTYDELAGMYDEAGQPIDKDVARMAAFTVGVANGAIEVGTLQFVLGKFPIFRQLRIGARKEAVKLALQNATVRKAFKDLAKNYGTTLTSEVATEVGQRLVSIVGRELEKKAEGGKLPTVSKADAWDDLMHTAVEAVPEFALGLGVGSLATFREQLSEAKQAEQSIGLFTALGEGVAQSKTASRSPTAFERLVEDASKDGPLADVFVPVASWKAYWQSQEIDPDEMATTVTGRDGALADATVTGNLRIPMARYASQLAGTEHNAKLLNELRLGRADAMNGREVEGFKAKVKAMQESVAAGAEGKAEHAEDARILRDAEEQLTASGVPRETSRTAVQALAGIANLARRAGEDPTTYWEQWGFRVTRMTAEEAVAAAKAGGGFQQEQTTQRPGTSEPAEVTTGQEVAERGQEAAPEVESASATVDTTGAANTVQAVVERVAQGTAADTGLEDEIPELRGLLAEIGAGRDVAAIDPDGGVQTNASGESAASMEALERARNLKRAGEKFVVYDRGGRPRDIVGADAVDYNARPGETFGIQGPGGFRVLTDNGGRIPPPGTVAGTSLENALRSTVTRDQSAIVPGVQAGVRVQGRVGPTNDAGIAAQFIGYQEGVEGIVPSFPIYNIVGGDMHGDTVGIEKLRELNIPVPPTPPLIELFQTATAMQPAFKEWFGNSVVVDQDGRPLVVYHGTTRIFSSFSREKANVESDFGAGFYFTNQATDVSANYAGVGADLEGKIENTAERLVLDLQDLDPTLDEAAAYREARRQATQEHMETGGLVIPLFLKFERPAIIGGPQETQLTYEFTEEDEDGDGEVQESGTLLSFVQALREVASDFDDIDVDAAISSMLERGMDGTLSLREAIDIARKDEGVVYATDADGNYASNEVIRQALERAGFDGVIDHTVNEKFGDARRAGQPMQGMGAETVHYIAFRPDQMRSAVSNAGGNFDPLSGDWLFQTGDQALDTMQPAASGFYTKLQRTVEEVKQPRATGKEWKGMIRNSKIGVNMDEFALTKIDDLVDGQSYTKDEVLAYVKLNRPQLHLVVLGEDGASGDIDSDLIDERTNELEEAAIESEMEDLDWDDIVGEATTIEDEVEEENEVERHAKDADGNYLYDDDGNEVMETVYETEYVTRYYPAVSGGYRQGSRGAGGYRRIVSRDETEIIEDGEAYETDRQAQRAADAWVREQQGEDWARERAYEQARENVDWGDLREQAERELRDEGEGGRGTHYEQYTLDPKPEDDSYREVFIRTDRIEKPPFEVMRKREIEDKLVVLLYGDEITLKELTPEQRAPIDERVPKIMEEQKTGLSGDMVRAEALLEDHEGKAWDQIEEAERAEIEEGIALANRRMTLEHWLDYYTRDRYARSYAEMKETDAFPEGMEEEITRIATEKLGRQKGGKGGYYTWKDGHSGFEDIENPIVRVRLSVRRVGAEFNSAELEAAVSTQASAQAKIDALLSNYPVISERPPWVVGELDTQRLLADEASTNVRRLQSEKRVAEQRGANVGERILFIEEIQPPQKSSGNFQKMPRLFQDTWRQIAWRWVVKHAVENGYEHVAWTTGRQQIEHYPSIEGMVEEIIFTTDPDQMTRRSLGLKQGEREVHIALRSGSSVTLVVSGKDSIVRRGAGQNHEDYKKKPLGDVIGMELAESIRDGGDSGTITGKQLAVGGQGLKKLYEVDYPAEIRSIPAVKKSGAKIATVPMLSDAEYLVEEVPEAEQAPTTAEVETETAAAGTMFEDAAKEAVGPMTWQVRRGADLVQRFHSRESATAWKAANARKVRPQPALTITPELAKLVEGGTPFYQREHYKPQTVGERDSLQQELDLVLQTETAERGNAAQMTARITEAGELHVEALGVNTEGAPRGIGVRMMRACVEFADAHDLQVSLDQLPSAKNKTKLRDFFRRLGFIQNGTHGFHEPSARGQWVRPAKGDGQMRRRYQEAEKGNKTVYRGGITFQRRDHEGGWTRGATIALFEQANLSTFLHETGHFYLEVYGDLVERIHAKQAAGAELTPEQSQMLDDYAAILAHLKVATRDQIATEHHELFARSFEAYLFTGKAPTPELREAFSRMRAWLLSIYKSLTALKAPLSKEITQVFDRMLASDQAIAEAEEHGRMQPMFLTPDQAGMSPGRFAVYREALEAASASARETLDRQLLTEVTREQQAWWQDRRAEVMTEVTAELQAQPVYRAISAIQRGTHPNGESLVEGAEPVPLKLSTQIIEARFGGKARARSLPRTFKTSTDGMDPDVVAEFFGFTSGDELLTAVASAEQFQKAVVAETDKRMLAEHGSMLLDGSVVEMAQEAVADEQRDIVLREELRALAKLRDRDRALEEDVVADQVKERDYERRWFAAETKLKLAQQRNASREEIEPLKAEVRQLKAKARSGASTIRGAVPSFKAITEQAQDLVSRMLVGALKAEPYFAAARQASSAATAAAARQDFDTAIEEKQREITTLAIAREIQRAKQDATVRVRAAQQLGKPGALAKLRIAGQTYHDQVCGVLDRFQFAQVSQKALERRAALWRWVKGLESQGQDIDLPEELLDETRKVHYTQLTVSELIGITDGLTQIAHLARFKNRLSKNQQKRRLNALAADLKVSIEAHHPTTPEASRDRRSGGERKRSIMAVLASHRKLASLIREMDGWVDAGPMWEAIMRPLNEAGAREAVMNAEATERFDQLVEAGYPAGSKRLLYERAFVPAVGQSMSRMERLMVALNWGNEGNRDRLKNAEGWTDDQVQGILDTLDDRDATFVQGTLDFIGSYWQQIAAKSERINGTRPTKVEATPIRIGLREIPGGYFPLKYDDRRSAVAASRLDLEAANLAKLSAVGQATTRRGHEKERAASGDQPVRWDFGVITEHVQQVVHDLSHHETLIDVGRILQHKDVSQTIVDRYGDITYKTIKNTIRDIALGDVPAQNGFEKALNHGRTGGTIAGIAWSLTTVAVQPLGLFPALVRLGPVAMGRGLRHSLGTPGRMSATVEWIHEQSEMMRTRHLTQNREINDIRNKVGIYSGKLTGWVDDVLSTTTFGIGSRQGIADSYFYFVGKMQQVVDVPTWLGGYHKAINEGRDHATAVQLADQTVIDTQSGGMVKDLAEVQRGGPALKLFTNFYSAFSALYNQAVESGKKTTLDPLSIGRLGVDYMLLFVVPATLGYLITSKIKGDDSDKKKSWAEVLVRENLAYLMGTMVGVRELSGAVQGYYNYSGPAGSRVFATASKAVQQVGQGELDEALVKSVNDTAGILFHVPAARVWNAVKGLSLMIEGKTSDPRVLIKPPAK